METIMTCNIMQSSGGKYFYSVVNKYLSTVLKYLQFTWVFPFYASLCLPKFHIQDDNIGLFAPLHLYDSNSY